MEYAVTFSALPRTLAELKAMPEASLHKPVEVVALTVAALAAYPESRDECYAMLDYLRGPRPLSPMEKQFIRDRFMDGKDYIPRSYFTGATPDNDYTPVLPYTVCLKDSASQFAEGGYRKFDVYCGGADSPRPVTLRTKPSTGEWFLWEQSLLVGIKIPKSSDPWA